MQVKSSGTSGDTVTGYRTSTDSDSGPSKDNPHILAAAPASDHLRPASPIRHLPQELLLAIFSILAIEARPLLECAGQKPICLCDIPWIVLPSVCSWWRKSSDLCPDLWTVINFWTSETTAKLLRKSGSRPIDLIFVSGHHAQFSSQAAVFNRALKKKFKVFQRARSIKFVLEDMPDEERYSESPDWSKVIACSRVLTTILSTPAPQALSLYLANTFDFEEMPHRAAPSVASCHAYMYPTDYPQLRQLYLDSWITVAPDDLFLRICLTSLTLAHGVYFEKFGEFLDVLARMPTLVNFSMDNCDDDIFDRFEEPFEGDNMAEGLHGHRHDPGSVELPNLELFELTMCYTDLAIDIMHWVTMPRTVRLILKRAPFMGVKAAEDPADIQVEAEGIFDMLETHFSLHDLDSVHELKELIATTEMTTDERERTISTFRICAYNLRQSHSDECATEHTPQLDMSLSFCADDFDSAIADVLFRLPPLLGNDATHLRLSSSETTSNPSHPSGQIIYHAKARDETLTMHPLGLTHLSSVVSDSEPPSPSSESEQDIDFFPNLVALDDYHGLELPPSTLPTFEERLNVVVDSLRPRVEAGTLREVNVHDGYADEAGVEELKKRLGDVVKWEWDVRALSP
ncbi:hypothetical protein PENSPDRAFT_750064 [Peniophora sp. CONT]|nr:hypothetical protein PENSPDRAFT_750064 [Peniophora sp. CONT]